MDIFDSHPEKNSNFRSVAGVVLILAGGALFIDRYLNTGWLSLMVLPSIGLFFYLWGTRVHHPGMILTGGILGGTGAGIGAALSQAGMQQPLLTQVGLIALYSGIGWGAAVLASAVFTVRPFWWALIPTGVLSGLGVCLLFSQQTWGDYVICLSLGVGIPLLVWGLASRLIGLAIPGCLVIGTGLGVYLGWDASTAENGLVQTGIMLVWFSFGWAMITLSSRFILQRFVWWPLIPGGIQAVVGWGLYIGGDPDNALNFISNTGAIGLMIFGLYLLLMRKGIHH